MEPVILFPSDRLSRHYSRRVEQILSRFNDIRELMQHEGAKGTRVEGEVRKFLLEFLPKRYEYGSGIVIDSSSNEIDRSRQEDILVIDRFFNPKLFLDEEPTVYPVEVIYCGIEVKTSLDENGLKTAINNIASLKRLSFIRAPVTYMQGNNVVMAETSPPLGIIFAFETSIKSAETLLKHYANALKDIDPYTTPDLICILNRGIMGISNESSKPRFSLYGLIGLDKETGRINAMELASTKEGTRPAPPDEITNNRGQRFPVMLFEDKYYPVDTARTFISFWGTLYEMLLSKRMLTDTNLLTHYIPRLATHFLYKDYTE